jgi:hypothetical protein
VGLFVLTQRGLRNAESVCGLAEVQFLGDRHEISQVPQFDIHTDSVPDESVVIHNERDLLLIGRRWPPSRK